ncbi:MAG: efflux RND transporter periplasmic adaptor subunit [Candidatus Eiseniibacteriota bacterium]
MTLPTKHDTRPNIMAFWTVSAFGAALVLSSCAKDPGAGAGQRKMPPVPVELAEVSRQTVRDGFHALGTLEADEQVEVTSEEAGVVRRLPFAEGRPVAQGTVLAVLDQRAAKADADRATAVLSKSKMDAERSQQLFERGIVSSTELERAQTDLKVAEANDAAARTRYDKTMVRAPFSGVVGRRRISPGAYVRAGDVITDLARTDMLRLAFQAPERFAGRLRNGTKVEVRPAAFPDRTFGGTVAVVDPVIDSRTRTISLVARIPNRDRSLVPGMSADVVATLSERTDALTVPDEAVFAEGDQSFVYKLAPDTTVVRTAVTLGTREAARVEVLSGLSEGDRVVRAGHQKLYPGARVFPSQSSQSGADSSTAAVPGAGR